MPTLSWADYRDKVLACWMGKNIGGTLGAPMEWKRQVNHVDFYTQELKGEALPNDDLDIQLVWLTALEDRGVGIDAHVLAEYWTLLVAPHWNEYGTGKVNMRMGLMPPLCGDYRNAFRDSCGSFIRSEIWACIAPGAPSLAARYATEDSMLDHGAGEGTWAAIFTAAIESAAFVLQDIGALIELGLSYIPGDCGVAGAIRCACQCHRDGKGWQEARDEILRHFRGDTAGGNRQMTSQEDWRKGFGDGKRGWDVPSNMGMLVIGLLWGEGDFGKTICTAVNCGEDTDCTAATAGSLFGILHGMTAIPQRWIDPIGRGIKTIAINRGDCAWRLAGTVDELTSRTAKVARQVALRFGGPLDPQGEGVTKLDDVLAEKLGPGEEMLPARVRERLRGPVFNYPGFVVETDVDGDPSLRDGEARTVRVRLRTGVVQSSCQLHWYAPEGVQVLPSPDTTCLVFPPALGPTPVMEFQVLAAQVRQPLVRLALEVTINSRPQVILVPFSFVNANALPRDLSGRA